jgi:tRNA A-37 threonylcarbamoyl transferase component Bud32
MAPVVVGARIAERYVLLEQRARGTTSTIFRAFDERTHREVIVKVLRRGRGSLDHALEEARIAGGARHPGVVSIVDVGGDRDQAFLVMELLEGSDLRAIVTSPERELSPAAVVVIGRALAEALAALHRSWVAHGAVELRHVVLHRAHGAPASVKLVDFGAARSLDRGGDAVDDVCGLGRVLRALLDRTPRMLRPRALVTLIERCVRPSPPNAESVARELRRIERDLELRDPHAILASALESDPLCSGDDDPTALRIEVEEPVLSRSEEPIVRRGSLSRLGAAAIAIGVGLAGVAAAIGVSTPARSAKVETKVEVSAGLSTPTDRSPTFAASPSAPSAIPPCVGRPAPVDQAIADAADATPPTATSSVAIAPAGAQPRPRMPRNEKAPAHHEPDLAGFEESPPRTIAKPAAPTAPRKTVITWAKPKARPAPTAKPRPPVTIARAKTPAHGGVSEAGF